jgi:hypothetical protein
MEELSTMHNQTFPTSENDASVVVIVLEVCGPVVWVEETVPKQRFRPDHKARKIGAVGDLLPIDMAPIIGADGRLQICCSSLAKDDEPVEAILA